MVHRDALGAALARLESLEAKLAEATREDASRERLIQRLRDEREELVAEIVRLRAELARQARAEPAAPAERESAAVDVDRMVADAASAARSGRSDVAFELLKSALVQAFGHAGARMLLDTARCGRCRKRVAEPSAVSAVGDYGRFWRGVCPKCETPLVLG